MVRVGRVEAMHPSAREVSSQTLVRRDRRARLHHDTNAATNPALQDEVIMYYYYSDDVIKSKLNSSNRRKLLSLCIKINQKCQKEKDPFNKFKLICTLRQLRPQLSRKTM